MIIKKIVLSIKTFTGATKSELTAVLFVFLGLFGGLVLKGISFNSFQDDNHSSQDLVFKVLDSLADAHESTFVGTDINNNPDSILAIADTIVEKEKFAGSQLPSRKEEFTGMVNLNTASRVQLQKVPGIGEKTAIAIIEYRKTSPFRTIEDIMEIKGIGKKKFEKMKEHITVR